MSIGLSLITAVLVDGQRASMRQLRDEYFTSDEVAAWNFLREYHQHHGGLPSVEAFAENGHTLTAATGNFSYHLERVRRRAIYNTIQANHGALNDALQARDMDAAVDALGVMQGEVSRVRAIQTMSNMSEWATRVRDGYDESRSRDDVEGITLGWEPLDRMTHGAYPGDVVVVVGRPSEGKSYTISNMSLAAWRTGSRVLFVTMEMTDDQIAHRLVGLNANIDPSYIRSGRLSHHVFPEFERSVEEFRSRGGEFHLVSGDLRKSVRDVDALVQDVEPDIVYIDASYLLKPEAGRRGQSRWEVLADVGEGIKELALARHVPVVHTVQFNRQAKAKSKGDHDLGMIGGTDVIGQVATVVIGIRPGVPPHERTRRRYNVLKNREGDTGRFTTNFLFQPIDFSVVADDHDSQDHESMRAQEQAMQDMSTSML